MITSIKIRIAFPMKRLKSIIEERFDSIEGMKLLRLIRSHQHHRLGRHGEKTCIDVLIEEVKDLPEVSESQSQPRLLRRGS
jgi:hypothetical protein